MKDQSEAGEEGGLGLTVMSLGEVTINSRETHIAVSTESNKIVAASVGKKGSLTLGGNVEILADALNEEAEANGIEVFDNSTVEVTGNTVVKASNSALSSDNNSEIKVVGSETQQASLQASGEVTLLGQTTLENAELFIDDEAGAQVDNLTAKNAVISLGAGEHTIGTIEGDAKSIELRDLEKGSVSVNSNIGALTISTTGSESDRYTNARLAAEALNEAVTITTNDPSNNSQIFVQEGDVNNAFTATVNSSGELVDVHEVKNTKLDAYSSVSSLAAIEWRSELNDLNKRMGDLRDNPGAIGAWARLYGSEQEYGAQNITNKSASFQVGGDYQVGAWKVGGAFSYTDGSSTYDAGEADNETFTVS